jgi:glutamine synthetase
MGSIARQIVEEHWELCLAAGINHEGINAEVAKGPVGIPDLRQRLRQGRRRHLGPLAI